MSRYAIAVSFWTCILLQRPKPKGIHSEQAIVTHEGKIKCDKNVVLPREPMYIFLCVRRYHVTFTKSHFYDKKSCVRSMQSARLYMWLQRKTGGQKKKRARWEIGNPIATNFRGHQISSRGRIPFHRIKPVASERSLLSIWRLT